MDCLFLPCFQLSGATVKHCKLLSVSPFTVGLPLASLASWKLANRTEILIYVMVLRGGKEYKKTALATSKLQSIQYKNSDKSLSFAPETSVHVRAFQCSPAWDAAAFTLLCITLNNSRIETSTDFICHFVHLQTWHSQSLQYYTLRWPHGIRLLGIKANIHRELSFKRHFLVC